MANAARRTRSVSKPPPAPASSTVASVKLSVCDVSFLHESYARLYAIHASGERDGTEFKHPNPTNLVAKEALVKAISNWQLVHGDPDEAGECDCCGGTMDVALAQSGKIPERCVYCGDGEEFGAEGEDPKPKEKPKKSEPPPKVEEKPEKPSAKAKKVSKKRDGLVKVEREEKPEIVEKEAKDLLDEIERVRGSLGKTTQDVYAEMWGAGKFFQELQKSKRWQKHPSAFGSWKDFVEGCFGVLVNTKKVEELVLFYTANKEVPRLDAGVMKLPQLPKPKNPRPRSEREEEPGETGPQHDPNFISVAGAFKKKQKLPFLTSKGKPAKKISETPFIVLRSENGVEIKVTLGQNPKGELLGVVTISRDG
jgi:hypothetical protein